jgi:hypothetical protein
LVQPSPPNLSAQDRATSGPYQAKPARRTRALAYFERDARFGRHLTTCDDTDSHAEFLLEKGKVIRVPFGGTHRLRAGDLIGTHTQFA